MVRHARGAWGRRVPRRRWRQIHGAMLLAVLDGNPSPPVDGGEVMRVATAETTTLIEYFIRDLSHHGRVSASEGQLVRIQKAGFKVGHTSKTLPEPQALKTQRLPSRLDPIAANATYRALDGNTDDARRAAIALEWLRQSWWNAHPHDARTRVVMLYAGYEALLDSSSTEDMAAKLAVLLSSTGPTRERHWTNLHRKQKSGHKSDVEWWAMQFGFLRNAIMHGGPEPSLSWGPSNHFWVGERRLREALLATIADATGEPELLLPIGRRTVQRAVLRHRQLI